MNGIFGTKNGGMVREEEWMEGNEEEVEESEPAHAPVIFVVYWSPIPPCKTRFTFSLHFGPFAQQRAKGWPTAGVLGREWTLEQLMRIGIKSPQIPPAAGWPPSTAEVAVQLGEEGNEGWLAGGTRQKTRSCPGPNILQICLILKWEHANNEKTSLILSWGWRKRIEGKV